MPGLMKLSTGVFRSTPRLRRLARGRSAGERENSRTDDRADAETGEIKRGERPLHFALGRFRFVGSRRSDSWF